MEINKTVEGNKLTLKIVGRLDTMTAPQLEAEISEIENKEEVILDFENLEYISSAGLRVLLKMSKITKGKEFRVINCNSDILEIFEITGFKEYIKVE